MALVYGQRLDGPTREGVTLRAAVFDERQVRAAAGLMLMVGIVAFFYALLDAEYVLLKVASTFFLVEFLVRVTVGVHRSPLGLLARPLVSRYPPEWTSAKPKRFAWALGLVLAGAMTVITNAGITGWLPRSLCLVCIVLTWSESVLGVCIGCEVHAFTVRRGWATKDPAFEICAGGVCGIPAPAGVPDAVGVAAVTPAAAPLIAAPVAVLPPAGEPAGP